MIILSTLNIRYILFITINIIIIDAYRRSISLSSAGVRSQLGQCYMLVKLIYIQYIQFSLWYIVYGILSLHILQCNDPVLNSILIRVSYLWLQRITEHSNVVYYKFLYCLKYLNIHRMYSTRTCMWTYICGTRIIL